MTIHTGTKICILLDLLIPRGRWLVRIHTPKRGSGWYVTSPDSAQKGGQAGRLVVRKARNYDAGGRGADLLKRWRWSHQKTPFFR